MNDQMPKTKWQRGVTGGKTAARMGKETVKYLVKKPFLSRQERAAAKKDLDENSARVLFQGLTLLKGTALKIAQMLSMELDLFPDSVRKELEKSYNQVPPLNRALVRKAVENGLGMLPEEAFASFDLTAFAAASLGQVHRAISPKGDLLAVKVKYPGIQATIKSDLDLVKSLVKFYPDQDLIAPALAEIEQKLLEEIDYIMEAQSMSFFARHLKMDRVAVPSPSKDLSSQDILSATFLEGIPLNQWIKTHPDRKSRDQVAQTINDIFLKGFYELHCIHADPHPGNFIIGKDLRVGLVDFGCVKRFEPGFVKIYQQLVGTIIRGDRDQYFRLVEKLDFIRSDLDGPTQEDLFKTAFGFGQWLGQAFRPDRFDFNENKNFMAQGKVIANQMLKHKNHLKMNPDFVFLDRTRYGLFRVFEMMGARVRMKNIYEWDE